MVEGGRRLYHGLLAGVRGFSMHAIRPVVVAQAGLQLDSRVAMCSFRIVYWCHVPDNRQIHECSRRVSSLSCTVSKKTLSPKLLSLSTISGLLALEALTLRHEQA